MKPSNLATCTAAAAVLVTSVGASRDGTFTDLPRSFTGGISWLTELALAHPQMALATAALLVITVVLPAALTVSAPASGDKDPRRVFTEADRRAAFDRAGNRCEYDGWLWFRCRRPAHHADHFFPHTRGGATTMRNLVASCTACNLTKSSHLPTLAGRRRLQRRRRRYFPAGIDVTAGQWFGR